MAETYNGLIIHEITEVTVTSTLGETDIVIGNIGSEVAAVTTLQPKPVNGSHTHFKRIDGIGTSWTLTPSDGHTIKNSSGVAGNITLSPGESIMLVFFNDIWETI